MYEDTLFEKLTNILVSKLAIQAAIKEIGSTSIDDSTLLKDYPSKIREIHSNIIEVCKYLNYIVYGGNLDVKLNNDIGIEDTYDYIMSIFDSKKDLATNLNGIGTEATYTEPLNDLVEKVYTGSQRLLEEINTLKSEKSQLEFEKLELENSNKELEATVRTLTDELDRINGEYV